MVVDLGARRTIKFFYLFFGELLHFTGHHLLPFVKPRMKSILHFVAFVIADVWIL